MKIRNGFVSNSSSSSFCVYGAYIDYDAEKLVNIMQKNNFATNEIAELKAEMDDEFFDCYEIIELFNTFLEERNLSCELIYQEMFIVGRSYDTIGDDETGKQFRDHVQAEINKLFSSVEFDYIEEAWRDG